MIDKVLIFSGTTEGRRLAEVLSDAGVSAVVCVATEYGSEVMDELPGVYIRQGRQSAAEMTELMKEGFIAVVDATHPFATAVSENIKEAAKTAGLDYLRLSRSTQAKGGINSEAGINYFDTNEECAHFLQNTEGNILLTTGSKELPVYCADEGLTERLFVRVLPSEESIASCREHGIKSGRIIAMQGPFSENMNIAMMDQYDIRVMVTKESGTTGGFDQKRAAAARAGVKLFVIKNPERSEGMDFDEVCLALEKATGKKISLTTKMNITLIGAGMGDTRTMLAKAREKLQGADLIFGAKRLTDGVAESGEIKPSAMLHPLYRADDIIKVLNDILRGGSMHGKQDVLETVVLFSGDTGFYSGAGAAYEALKAWSGDKRNVILEVIPGISSVSYFASKLGTSWEDAAILSVHGRGKKSDWQAEVLYTVGHRKKTLILVSDSGDVHDIGSLLVEYQLGHCRLFAGCRLSMKEERIVSLSPAECGGFEGDGPIIIEVENDRPGTYYLAPHLKDADFIRGDIPMTKEEVRNIAVCKLELADNAVVYDIGSGTGSVAVAIAERSGSIRVFAIERNESGIDLIRKNCKKFGLTNVEMIHGKAPEALEELPAPTHAFIGGSGGRLMDILKLLHAKNPCMRIVITAVTLETVGEISAMLKKISVVDEEVVQVQVTGTRKAGEHTLMRAENPVFICSFAFSGKEGPESDG